MTECYVCKQSWTEWETPCGEWVCGTDCAVIHSAACSWCQYILNKQAKKETK